jgi:peptidoglycan hydrolase CwlO-like protein
MKNIDRQQIESLSNLLSQERQTHAELISALESQLSALKSKLSSLTNQNSTISTSLVSCNTQITNLNSRVVCKDAYIKDLVFLSRVLI